MKKVRSISFVSGVIAVFGYLFFTLLAYSQYPLPFSPMTNWLSDLGNVNLNPNGAIFYNIGIILTALMLLLFFLGLSVWMIETNRVQVVMLRLAQIFGGLGALFMMLSAIFPINNLKIHSFWSTSLYVMLSTGFIFSAAALRYHKSVPVWLLILGISTAPLVILTKFFPTMYILEWVIVIIFLAYVSLVGIATHRLHTGITPKTDRILY
jgi:hypothetical membrane protein